MTDKTNVLYYARSGGATDAETAAVRREIERRLGQA